MNTEFAQEWLMAWNSHDLNKIMEHYSEKIDFVSPIIQQMGINAEGKISNKSDLKDYFSKASLLPLPCGILTETAFQNYPEVLRQPPGRKTRTLPPLKTPQKSFMVCSSIPKSSIPKRE